MLRRFASKSLKYYQILELTPEATPEQIKAAYNRLVMKYHPDTTSLLDKKLAAEKFKEVIDAKTILLSPDNNEKEKNSDFYSEETILKKPQKESSYKNYEDFRKHYQSKEKENKGDQSFKSSKFHDDFFKNSKKYSSSKPKEDPEPSPLPNTSFSFAMASLSAGLLFILLSNSKSESENYTPSSFSNQNSKTFSTPQKPQPAPSNQPMEVIKVGLPRLNGLEKSKIEGKKLEYMYKGQSGQHRRFTLLSGDDNDHSVFKCNTCHAVVTKAHMADHVEYYRLEHLKKNSKINSK